MIAENVELATREFYFFFFGFTAVITERKKVFTDSEVSKTAATSGSRTIAIVPCSIFPAKRFGLDFA